MGNPAVLKTDKRADLSRRHGACRILRLHPLAAALFLWLFVVATVWAAPYTKTVVFGDSLSDVGNFHHLVGWPSSPYWQGRASNGPVWVEDLAVDLGVPSATAYWAGGANLAICGATTSSSYLGLGWQVNTYLATVSSVADPGALYTVWSGANDFFNTLGSDPGTTELANCASTLGTWASRVAGAVSTLHGEGAVKFLVPNLPPLGSTPKYAASANKTAINSLVADFNGHLAADLQEIEAAAGDLQIQTLDVYGLFNQLVADPGRYGLTNVTDPAMTTSGADPAKYLFWDDVHPTAAAHALLAAHCVLPGDATYDGQVDQQDAAVLASHWGAGVTGGAGDGDFNGDGVANAADASILAANWSDSAAGESTAVPEPGVLALLAGVLALLVARRR